jgi:hypothetical protein
MTQGLVPLADDLAKLQPPLLHLIGLGSHLLLDRRSLYSSRHRLRPRRHRCLQLQLIAERPKVLKLSERGLERQGRSSRGTPTPLGYGYLTSHLPCKATHDRLSGSASRQASPSARNEGETRHYTQMPRCSGLDSHNERTPILRVPLQTGLRFHSRGYEQPPHQRACGITNSRWLTDDHCTSSDNDLRLGRLNSSSDDLRANAAVKGPLLMSQHEGRGQAIKAKELEVRPQVAPTVSLAETASSGYHHLSTDDSGHLRAGATPTNGGRPSLHRQIPTQVLADGPAPASVRRHRAGVRTRQSKNTNAALVAYDVLDDPPVQSAAREGSQTCPTCARRDSRPCGGRTATPGPSGRRQRQRRR